MSAPPAPLVWPQGLTTKTVPTPDELMKLDANVKDLGVRVGNNVDGFCAAQMWQPFTPIGALLWDDYYERFYYLSGTEIRASYTGLIQHETYTTLAGLSGGFSFSCENDGDGKLVIIIGHLSDTFVKVISSPDGTTFTERTFASSHGGTLGLGHATWTGSAFMFSNGYGGVEVSADGDAWSDCATQPAANHYGVQSAAKVSAGLFITAGSNGYSYTTDNGTTWNSISWSGFAASYVVSFFGARAWYDQENDVFLFAGKNGTSTPCIFVVNATTLLEEDSIQTPLYGPIGTPGALSVATHGGALVACVGNDSVVFASKDRGTSWVNVPGVSSATYRTYLSKFRNRLYLKSTSEHHVSFPHVAD